MRECRKNDYSEARRHAIAKGLLELMMQMPYEKIAVGNLCEHLQISRKTFYRYFSNKEEALQSLVDDTLLEIGTYTPPVQIPVNDLFQEEMVRFFYYWSANRQVLQMFLENSLIEALFFRAIHIALTEMDIFRKKLAAQDAKAQESITSYYVGGLLTMLLSWLANGFTETPEQMAQRVVFLNRNRMDVRDL